jgi:hypothetical protein
MHMGWLLLPPLHVAVCSEHTDSFTSRQCSSMPLRIPAALQAPPALLLLLLLLLLALLDVCYTSLQDVLPTKHRYILLDNTPVAQKVQPIWHPTCEDTHSVLRLLPQPAACSLPA